MRFVPHDKMRQSLVEQGLVDAATGDITAAGHEYVRDLMRRINTHRQTSSGKADQYLKAQP
ncbi:hypothetical protein IVA80_10880 [Bradyrhizobium sp. 139]|uniref:hypothetical protein n=1 Tax=Bradyrhizobium sp. 139 TaxID=2782616 RepID=UPI001FF7A898|nr:hypothetical protein [Bradyrhizobium sp. 139]MCK1741354.1 hypothetical protein [Bradyrhizobium sp. 139]